MSNFVSLEEAAKKLGVSVDELVDMRSQGEIFGYRDGGSWKFKPEEIERVASEMLGADALDEDPAGSSILVSDSDLGSGSKHGSTIGSDVENDEKNSDVDSDVALVADPGGGSDVRLVANEESGDDDDMQLADSEDNDEQPASSEDNEVKAIDSDADEVKATDSDDDDLKIADSDDDDDELSLAAEDGSDLLGSGTGSDVPIGSDLDLAQDSSDITSGSGDSDLEANALGSDLELAADDDLVLGSGSDLALGNDSGINLMQPGDSGISLEDEPLDLAASGISGLDLAAEGSDAEGSGAGSAVDFQQDEEFQLSPSGSLDADDDSGSQVIELEDSSEFGDAAVALPAEEGFDAFADVDGGGGLEDTTTDSLGAAPAGAATTGAPEIPYSLLQVLSLLGILLLMCLSGILVTDVVRNMWAWTGEGSGLTSGFTSMVLSAFGQ